MSTIRDVAELADVSIATVSRVLNDSGYVSPELAARVREAIDTLGYQRNAVARNLRRRESLTIGMLIPNSNNPFFAEIARGVEDFYFDKGFMVVLCNTDENPDKEASYFNTLSQQRVAGLIVVSTGQRTPHLQRLLRDGFPIVLVDRPLPDLPTDSVVSDNYGGARQAIQHLIDLRHRRIGLVIGQWYLETIKTRVKGALDTLQAAQIPLDPQLIHDDSSLLPRSGYDAARQLLDLPNPPTAIFAVNDLLAFGVLNHAHERRIMVPEQLSVVGFDDIMMASYSAPGLTTVVQPKYNLGRTVADILLRRIQGNRNPPERHVLPTRLEIRQSTAALS